MEKFQVVETFVSINGEGKRAGELAVFIRFLGCNLNCSYCDTKWANLPDAEFRWMNEEEIYQYVKETGVRNVTLTGGEPLLRPGMEMLLTKLLGDSNLRVEIETNGSIDLTPFANLPLRPSFTMDYKLAGSGMEDAMNRNNFSLLTAEDTVKFVVGSKADLERSAQIIAEENLLERTAIYFSPVFGKIEPEEIVNFLIAHKLNDVRVQLQLHKFIWDPDQKGV